MKRLTIEIQEDGSRALFIDGVKHAARIRIEQTPLQLKRGDADPIGMDYSIKLGFYVFAVDGVERLKKAEEELHAQSIFDMLGSRLKKQ